MKKISLFLGAGLLASSLHAGVCSDSFKFDFTFYGGPDKEYVVTKNTFKKFEVTFPEEKLLNSTISIDAMSIDTSADPSNIDKQWPAGLLKVRDNNTKTHFFKNFETDVGKISAKIVSINDEKIDLEVTMNGVTKVVPLTYKIDGDLLKATGKLDVLEFNTSKAWEKFEKVCKSSFHHGKSWNELDINFEVSKDCK